MGGRVFKAPVLTKSAAADLGREPAGQAGERSERQRGRKTCQGMFFAKLAWRCMMPPPPVFHPHGRVAEWFKAPVLKTGVAETPP